MLMSGFLKNQNDKMNSRIWYKYVTILKSGELCLLTVGVKWSFNALL